MKHSIIALLVACAATLLIPPEHPAHAASRIENWLDGPKGARARAEHGAREHGDIFRAAGADARIDPDVLLVIAVIETDVLYDERDIIGDDGASYGMMHVSEIAAREVAQRGYSVPPDWKTNTASNVLLAAWYVRALLDFYGYALRQDLVVAYNAGPGRHRWLVRRGYRIYNSYYARKMEALLAYVKANGLL